MYLLAHRLCLEYGHAFKPWSISDFKTLNYCVINNTCNKSLVINIILQFVQMISLVVVIWNAFLHLCLTLLK